MASKARQRNRISPANDSTGSALARERCLLRDPAASGDPADSAPHFRRHLVVFPSPCRPATWPVAAEAEEPPQLPARPVPAGRGPQTRGCPLAAGCGVPAAPRSPARPSAISLPARRTSAPAAALGAGLPLREPASMRSARGTCASTRRLSSKLVYLRPEILVRGAWCFWTFTTSFPRWGFCLPPQTEP